ncbi:hypothetical protein ACLOJK_016539, partial [Asimina triloba]
RRSNSPPESATATFACGDVRNVGHPSSIGIGSKRIGKSDYLSSSTHEQQPERHTR